MTLSLYFFMLTNTKQKAFPLKHKETNKGTGEQLRGEVRSDLDANSWLLHPAFLLVLFLFQIVFLGGHLQKRKLACLFFRFQSLIRPNRSIWT